MKRVVIGICLSMLMIGSALTGATLVKNDGEILSYTFSLPEPKLVTTTVDNIDYSLIEMPYSIGVGNSHGAPTLPVQVISLLLPPMKTVKNVVVDGTKINVDLESYNLKEIPIFPYQEPVPTGDSQKEFAIDSNIYSKNELYPANIKKEYNIGYSHGYTIFDLSINPVKYNPVEGTLLYYSDIKVDIELKDTEPNQFYRNCADDEAWVEKLVDNKEMTDTYSSEIPIFGYDGGLCDPDDNYDYVIITTEDGDLDYWDTTGSIPYNWDSLMDKHSQDDGFSCALVTEQQIDECQDYYNGEPVDDLQSRIREFCKDAYQDWGTHYILVGGDAELIPARLMSYDYESNVDSDLYWSNLDNTFNADGDNSWGEEGDSGFDLYSEIFIGRLTCDEPQDVSNWMTKSFYYADSNEEDYLENAAFYAGDMGWSCEGDDFIDYCAIKGTNNWLGPDPGNHGPYPDWLGFQFGFETWNQNNPDNQYDLSVKWTDEPPNEGWQGGSSSEAISELRNAIDEDRVTLLIGVAHANPDLSLDVSSSNWESNYHNSKPFFIHDWGCHCGDMDDADDGVLHSMLFHSDTELAFACIYNTGYGWGSFQDTNSSSALQMKLFWDYFLDLENNSIDFNSWQLGKAMAWSKDYMAPTINWTYSSAPGSWRGIIQGCLLFGDPAQKIKTSHPSQSPETPEPPEGSDYGVPNEEYDFSARTIDPEEDQIFYLFDWGDGEYSNWIGPVDSGETALASHSWIDLGDYNIRVRAKDEWGSVSDWSDVKVFPIVENTPPDIPTISGPTTGKIGKPVEFTIVATDPDGQDMFYNIFWGNAGGGDLGPFPSGEEQIFEHTWTKTGKFTIKVKAIDVTGAAGEIGTFDIKISRARSVDNHIIEHIFQRFPNLFPIIRYMFEKM